MSATIAVLRVQIQMLFWPLVVSTLCLVLYLIIPGGFWEQSGLVVVVPMILGLVVWLAGPILHGSEFVEGARDFMATRPFSPVRLFCIKTTLLTVLTLVCVLFTCISLKFSPITLYILLGLTLSLTYCCSGMTLLTRDMVRGMLFGPLAWIGILVFIAYSFFSLTKLEWIQVTTREKLSGFHMERDLDFIIGASLCLAGAGISLWLDCVVEQSRRFGKLTVPLQVNLFLVPFIVLFLFMSVVFQNDGLIALNALVIPQRDWEILGMHTEGTRIYYVTRIQDKFDNTYFLKTVDLNDPKRENQTVGQFKLSPRTWIHDTPLFTSNRCVLYERAKVLKPGSDVKDTHGKTIEHLEERSLSVYSYDQTGGIQTLSSHKFYDTCFSPQFIKSGTDTILVKQWKVLNPGTFPNIRQPFVNEIDLRTGGIRDVSTETELARFERRGFISGNRRYWFKHVDENSSFFKHYVSVTDTVQDVTGSISYPLEHPTYVGNLLAGFDLDNQYKIHLVDTESLESPRTFTIEVPWRLQLDHTLISHFEPKRNLSFNLKLSKQFLFLVSPIRNRVVVWDIKNRDQIRCLGICELPDRYSLIEEYNVTETSSQDQFWFNPVLCPDGSIEVMLFHNGPVWLEFPALMKEAKS